MSVAEFMLYLCLCSLMLAMVARSGSCTAARHRPLSTSFAQSHRVQSWVRCCSLCKLTQRTLQPLRRSTVYLYTRSPTTRSCTFIVVVLTRCRLLPNWNGALKTSATGCPQTDSNSTLARRNCCGWDRDTVFPSKAVIFQCYNSVPTP